MKRVEPEPMVIAPLSSESWQTTARDEMVRMSLLKVKEERRRRGGEK